MPQTGLRRKPVGALGMERFSIGLTIWVSLPGLTGQSSIHGRWLLDRPVKPGDDSTAIGQNLNGSHPLAIAPSTRTASPGIHRHGAGPPGRCRGPIRPTCAIPLEFRAPRDSEPTKTGPVPG